MKHAGYSILLFMILLIFAGCEDEGCTPDVSPGRTVLFYFGGDNDLSGDVTAKIEQLKSVSVPAGCHLLVYADTRLSAPQLFELVTENGVRTMKVVREYAESNSASAETFGAVLQEVQALYPASSCGLVFFSHASGWMPEGAYRNPALRSVGIDGSAEMELSAFAAAIPGGMLDFVVFETCFMAGVEVVWELKEKTDYIVASSAEIVSPGFAPVYGEAVPLLFEKVVRLTEFCRKIEVDYRTRAGDYASLTLSLIDTKGLDALAAAVQGAGLPLSIAGIQSFDRNGDTLFFDFVECFSPQLPETQRAALQQAIDGCVVWKTATAAFMPNYGGFEVLAHCGLTIYIPQERYAGLNEAYKELAWCHAIIN